MKRIVSIEEIERLIGGGKAVVKTIQLGGKLLPLKLDSTDFVITLKAAEAKEVVIREYSTLISISDISFE